MLPRGKTAAHVVAVLLAALLGFNATHAAGLMSAPCARCPADCPMHVTGRRCHEGTGSLASATREHCHRQSDRGPGLRAGGCKGRPDGFTTPDQPALLPAALDARDTLPLAERPFGSPRRWSDVFTDPPFHPPPVSSVSA